MISGPVKGGITLFLAFVGGTGNLFVILVVASKRTFHTMHYFLLTSLALSDFLFHSFTVFTAVSLISEQWMYGIAWCKGNFYILKCLVSTTILLLCAVTWECHTAVVTPYEYSGDITVKKITVVVLLWITSSGLGAAPFFGRGRIVYNDKLHRCERDFKIMSLGGIIFTIVVFVVIPFGLITKQQYQINRIAKHQISQIAQQHHVVNSNSLEGQRQQRLTKTLKASKDAVIIVIAFLVSYLPVCVTMVLRKVSPESEEMYEAWFLVTFLCGQVGATWNPIIYFYRKRQFRRQFFSFFGFNPFRRVAPQVI